MVTGYSYELWNGKKVIGHIYRNSKIQGTSVSIPTISILKEVYGRKYEVIHVPVLYRKIFDDGVDITMRMVLDVRRKSKRQIRLIKQNKGM